MGGCVEMKCEGFDGWVDVWRGSVRDLMDGWMCGEEV